MLAEGGDYAQQFITEVKRDMIIITLSVKTLQIFSKSLAVCKGIISTSIVSQAHMIRHTQRMCKHLCYAHMCTYKPLHSEAGASMRDL